MEVAGVLGVPGSGVLRVFWIGAERAAAAGECLTGGDNGIGRCAFLDPIDDGAEHVEVIERRAAAAMSHSGHQEDAAPFSNLVGAAVGFGK